MLCIFDPIQAAFPLNLSLPYQGPQPGPGPLAPPSQPTQGRPSVRPNLPCQAWTRAVKAKRGSGSNDKRAEAHGKVLTLLHAFSSFFDLCQLMEEDEETGHNSVQAVLATRAPTTILKHVGPLRTFCEWLAKSGGLPPFPEKIVWSFVHCVLKMPRTAASTLDTCLKAIKWSYYALGLKVQLDVFQSARINGLAAKALQNKSPWDPASILQVSEEVPAAHTFSKSFFGLEHEPFKPVKMKVETRSGMLWRLPHEFALCSLQFRLLSGSLLLWEYVNVSYSFRGFAEPESGLARWYKF